MVIIMIWSPIAEFPYHKCLRVLKVEKEHIQYSEVFRLTPTSHRTQDPLPSWEAYQHYICCWMSPRVSSTQ